MKNSNIQWIGEIPDDWEVSKFKYVSTIYTGNSIKDEHKSNYESSEDARPYISSKDIDVHTGNVDYNNGLYIKKDDSTFRVARKGCSLMCIEGGSAGKKKALINQDVSFVNKLCCFQSNDKIDERFLYYYLCNPSYEEEFRNNISGMIGGVSVSVLKNFVILVPPLATQTSIATYLDAKCSEIDGLIADINKQIETLNELMTKETIQAISQGITKNELKDSNIEWCPKVASHWEIKPFKYVLYERSEKNTPIVTNERLSLSIGMGVTLYSEKTTNLDRYKDDVSQYKIAHKGDLVMNSMNVIVGAVGTSNYFGCVSPAYYTFYDNEEDHVTAKFCEYVFLTPQMRKVLYSLGKGIMAIDRGDGRVNTCRLKVSKYDLGKILIAVPPIEEQRSIVKYLEGRKMEINAIISDKQKQISTLEAYKKSLIYEYVTGKKEVK